MYFEDNAIPLLSMRGGVKIAGPLTLHWVIMQDNRKDYATHCGRPVKLDEWKNARMRDNPEYKFCKTCTNAVH